MTDIDELADKVERLEFVLLAIKKEVDDARNEMFAQTFPKDSIPPLSGLAVEIGFCRERLSALESEVFHAE